MPTRTALTDVHTLPDPGDAVVAFDALLEGPGGQADGTDRVPGVRSQHRRAGRVRVTQLGWATSRHRRADTLLVTTLKVSRLRLAMFVFLATCSLTSAFIHAHLAVSDLALVPEHPVPATGNAPADTREGRLVDAHGCWNGVAPAGVTPHHVVVTRAGALDAVYAGEQTTHLALEQIFAGKSHGMLVHAFCP